jgi:hypothetical protein
VVNTTKIAGNFTSSALTGLKCDKGCDEKIQTSKHSVHAKIAWKYSAEHRHQPVKWCLLCVLAVVCKSCCLCCMPTIMTVSVLFLSSYGKQVTSVFVGG